MKIEDFKNRQPFTVPENYFEQFNDNIMNMLPKAAVTEQKKHRTIALPRITRYISYAAMLAVVFIIGHALYTKHDTSNQATAEEHYEGEYIDEMLNNYPIDDYTFYCYLTGSDIN
ncbi:MAG: hypothetical protein IJ436_01235 [Bacteroidaceae bacterium]|nr:hypothetical protein [Bacteroidaceae bacterium]